MEANFKQLVGRSGPRQKNGVQGTYTIDFIPQSDIPQGQDITYADFFCDCIPLKDEPYQILLVVRGKN